ncbi:MAG: MraY family glycosyltransferase [Pseudomonadota bacterium]
MWTYVSIFFVSLIAALVLTPLARGLAYSVGAVDRGLSSRCIHAGPVPRLGGMGIIISFMLPLCSLPAFDHVAAEAYMAEYRLVASLLLGGALIAALGVYDDVRGANAGKKLAVQLVVAGVMYVLGFRLESLDVPLAGTVDLGVLSLPLTLLWVVAVINAVNLVDGLDGLAAGVALFASMTALVLGLSHGDLLTVACAAALGGAVVGFLFYNFHPATVFMGDTGSMFLGFILAVLLIRSGQSSDGRIDVLVPLVALALPLVDTTLAIVRRVARGQSPFTADREHIHHRLLAKGLSHRESTLTLYALSVVLGVVAFAISTAEGWPVVVLLALLVSTFAALLFWLRDGNTLPAEWRHVFEERQRNRLRWREVRRIRREVGHAESIGQAFAAVAELTDSLEATGVVLRVERPKTELQHGELAEATVCASFPIEHGRRELGTLEVGWNSGRTRVDRADEIAVELLMPTLVATMRRLAS